MTTTGSINHLSSFVEFETAADLRTAVEKLDGREFKGQRVTCVANVGVTPSIPSLLAWLPYCGNRLSRTPHHGTVPAPDPLAGGLTHLPRTTTTAEALLGEEPGTALAVMVVIAMAIVTEALAGITTTTVAGTGPLHVAALPVMTIRHLRREVATRTPTAVTTPLTRMLTGGLTTDLPPHRAISLRAMADTPGRALIPVMAMSVATGNYYHSFISSRSLTSWCRSRNRPALHQPTRRVYSFVRVMFMTDVGSCWLSQYSCGVFIWLWFSERGKLNEIVFARPLDLKGVVIVASQTQTPFWHVFLTGGLEMRAHSYLKGEKHENEYEWFQ